MDDIEYIIQESLKGDNLSKEILLEKLRPLIYKNIYYYYSFDDYIVEDLAQEGYAVILESLKTFDKSRNVHFLQYIKIKLKFYYKNYFRNTKNQRQTLSLDQNIEKYNNDIKYENIFDSNSISISMEDTIEINEENIELIKNIQKLTIKEQEVLNLYYFKKLSMEEVSKQLNICYRTAIGRKYFAMKKLRKLMVNKNGGENNG